MKKNETALGRYIYEKGYRKQYIIDKTGINRSDFFKGLKHPVIFSEPQLKSIAKALNIKYTDLKLLINN